MKLPRDVSGKAAVKALRRLGFEIVRQEGSHIRMSKGDRRVTIPPPQSYRAQNVAERFATGGNEFGRISRGAVGRFRSPRRERDARILSGAGFLQIVVVPAGIREKPARLDVQDLGGQPADEMDVV